MRFENHNSSGTEGSAFADTFGNLAASMLRATPLSPAWQVNFLANFFTGPIYRDVGARYGLSRPEFVILYTLSQRPGLVARDVCLATGLPKNSISRAVAALVRRGLVEQKINEDDRRAKPLTMTPNGSELLGQLLPLFYARQAAMLAVLSPEERREWDRLLAKLIGAMPDWVGPE